MRCEHVKDDGTRCGVTFGVSGKTGLCWHHDPGREDQRKRAQSEGGKSRADQLRRMRERTVDPAEAMDPPETAEDAKVWASWLTFAVATGQVDRGTGRELASILRCFLTSLEKAELQSEMQELRRKVDELEGRKRSHLRAR